jgi:hypothetical protein
MFGLYICANSYFFMGRTLNSSFSMLSLFFLSLLIAVALPTCTARIALVAAKILLVAMPRRDQ